jgi:hypothetical protein
MSTNRFPWFLLFAGLLLVRPLSLHAQPGYADSLKSACVRAGFPTPGLTERDCQVCHQNAANNRAYQTYQTSQAREDLEPLCLWQGSSGTGSSAPPVLTPVTSPQTLKVGTPLTLYLSAIDPDGDRIKLSVKKKPPGSSFKSLGIRETRTLAVFQWTPKANLAGKRYSVEFKAQEQGRRPAQSATVVVDFVISE